MAFNYTLEEIYSITDNLVNKYLTGGLDANQQERIIGDISEVSSQLIRTNCRRFLTKYNTSDIDIEELYGTAMGLCLYKALNTYTMDKGVHFVYYWYKIMVNQFINDLRQATSKKGRINGKSSVSFDFEYHNRNVNEGSCSVATYLYTDYDLEESTCDRLTLAKLIQQFEETDKYGKLIRLELIGTQSVRTREVLKVLGSDTYGDRERKAVQRTRERFRKLLIANGYEKELIK